VGLACPAMGVRTLGAGDEETLRSLRLRALADSPEQFSSTCEREAVRTVEDWRRWIQTGATFVFEGDGPDPLGLAAAVPDAEEDGVVWLMAMWVKPAVRGTGAAGALVDAVVAWGREHSARNVQLHVIDTNTRARRLYERHGFRATGDIQIDGRVEVTMERPIET
jgi:GNAT superfamily N-acetyltransferase